MSHSENSFRYSNSSAEVIRLIVLMYVRFPLSSRKVEALLFERGADICRETVRLWRNRFGPLFAAGIRRQRISRMRGFRQCRWHVDEMYVKIIGEMHYLWRVVDHDAEVLEPYVTKARKSGGFTVPEESDEAPRSPRGRDHGRASIVPCCDAGTGQS